MPTLAPHLILCPRQVAVDAKASSTRRAEDKQLIDSYVENSIGFALIDSTMTSAIQRQLARQRVFAAIRLGVYLGLVALCLYAVDKESVPVVGFFIAYVPESWYCDVDPTSAIELALQYIQCAEDLDTTIIGLVALVVVGLLWYVLSALAYWRLVRRPRARWARMSIAEDGPLPEEITASGPAPAAPPTPTPKALVSGATALASVDA